MQLVFTVAERHVIAAYFANHAHEVKPLPPGIAKRLARGNALPPGIAKQRLPNDLTAQLPSRTGVEITIVGDRIVLLEWAVGLVMLYVSGDLFEPTSTHELVNGPTLSLPTAASLDQPWIGETPGVHGGGVRPAEGSGRSGQWQENLAVGAPPGVPQLCISVPL